MTAKKRLLPILVAVLMVFAMMPMSAGTVYAEADPDVTPPVITLDNFTLSLPDGKDKATVGDTITATAEVTDDRYVKYVNIDLDSPVTGTSRRIDLEYTGTDETRSGIWTGTYTITDEDENGIWKIEHISTHDGQNEAVYSNNNVYSWGNADLSAYDFEVVAPECPADLTTSGYSMMLDGAGAISTFGGNYYVNTADETVTPTVKVRFDAEDGTWTTLSPRKYTLKYEKKTGNDSWEDYTADTFGVDEDGTATYRVSATGKESLYYTGTVSPVAFNVIKKTKVTFDTRGGSSIDPQFIIPGEKASKPADPTKEGTSFEGWYDESLTNRYSFDTPVNQDITLCARWSATYGFNSYDATTSTESSGGKFSVSESQFQDDPTYGWTFMTMDVGTERTLNAYPNEGYKFIGWYEGKVENIYKDGRLYSQTVLPKDLDDPGARLSTDSEYTITIEQNGAVCAVFECAGHQWDEGTVSKHATCKEPGTKAFKCTVCGTEKTEEIAIDPNAHVWQEKVQKATPTSDGRIYQACSLCGMEETITPLLKVSNIKLAGTSYTYTGKAIKPKVTVANANEALAADNYTVTYSKNTNAGTATAKVTLKGDYYEGTKSLTFKINKAANPLKVSAKTATVKYSKLKKKTQTLAVTKVIKFTKKLNDKKKYTLVSAKKGSKSFKKYFKVGKTTGKVTVKKGLKKGTYKVKVKVQALGNSNYKASAVKSVTFTVKVK